MAIVASGKVTACFLQAALVGLCLCMPAPAQANPVEGPTTTTSSSLPRVYQRWLDEDVRWIITPEERADFLRRATNADRYHFVEQFWLRRDPTPNTAENEFKEEHYRRIAFANVHFGWQAVAGWETDRGRIYILYGPPDAIRVESARDNAESLKPTELWHYFSAPRYGKDFRFVDVCGCGDYHLEALPRD